MAFEHDCGMVYEGRIPPMDCKFCATLLVKVTHGLEFRGWRWVPGTQGGPKSHKRAEAKDRRRRNKNKRGRVSLEKRAKIYKRDDYTCQGPCGRRLPPTHPDHRELTLDHKVPVSKGGSSRNENLQTMCAPCNTAKGSKMPSEAGEQVRIEIARGDRCALR